MKRIRRREACLRMEKRRKKRKLVLRICALFLFVLTVGFAGCEIIIDKYTMGNKTLVYGQDVSWLTPEQALEKISEFFADKQVSFYEKGECIYTVSLRDLGYSLDTKDLREKLFQLKKEKVKKGMVFKPEQDLEIPFQIEKNENIFTKALSEEHFKTDSERTESEDAYIKYDDKNAKFVIVDEKIGTQIDQNRLDEVTADTIQESLKEDFSRKTISVEINTDVYKQTAVTAASQELISHLDKLNAAMEKYHNTTIIYVFGDVSETIDPKTIQSWLIITNNEVEIDIEKVRSYVEELANKYDTIYVPRAFQTSNGQTVTLENNEYGFRIDQDAEVMQLCEDLQSGTTIQREPVYEMEGLTRNGTDDLNGSYIEVSLEQQHLWLYRDGGLVTDTDIISGLPTEDRATYTGAYAIAYKASPFTLSSDIYGYEVTVNYWMPFVEGQGLHDAEWQSQFGGEVYKTNGSHGCINLPPEQAEIIYDAIDGGYPIILY